MNETSKPSNPFEIIGQLSNDNRQKDVALSVARRAYTDLNTSYGDLLLNFTGMKMQAEYLDGQLRAKKAELEETRVKLLAAEKDLAALRAPAPPPPEAPALSLLPETDEH